RQFELVDLQRVDGENVAIRFVADRRAGAAPARAAEVGAWLHRTGGQLAAVGGAGALRQRMGVRRQVVYDPVPPAGTAGRRVGVVHQHGEALRTGRRLLPRERRRHVAAVAAEALEYVDVGDRRVRRKIGAVQFEGEGAAAG